MTISKSLQDKVNNLNSTIEKSQEELKKLRVIYSKFPDLEIISNRWKTERYCSKLVNPIATEVDIGGSCSCCADAAIMAYFSIKEDGITIYSNPPHIYIGSKWDHSIKYFDDNWEDNLIENNISPTAILFLKEQEEKYRLQADNCSDDDYDNS